MAIRQIGRDAIIGISGRVQNMTVSWFHPKPDKSNQHCPYCWVPVGEGITVSGVIHNCDVPRLISKFNPNPL